MDLQQIFVSLTCKIKGVGGRKCFSQGRMLPDSDVWYLAKVLRVSIHNNFNQVDTSKVESTLLGPSSIGRWPFIPPKTVSFPDGSASVEHSIKGFKSLKCDRLGPVELVFCPMVFLKIKINRTSTNKHRTMKQTYRGPENK